MSDDDPPPVSDEVTAATKTPSEPNVIVDDEVIEHPHLFVSSAPETEAVPEVIEHPHMFVSSAAKVEPEVVEHPHMFVSVAPAVADDTAPLLPEAYSENELRDAAGIESKLDKKKKEKKKSKREKALESSGSFRSDSIDDDDAPHKRSTRTMLVAAGSLVGGLGIVALIFLGRANSGRYLIACQPDLVVAEQGRSFPPWGTHALGGPDWKPIAIPPEAECRARETDDQAELAGWYLQILSEQASTLLTAREVTKVDLAEQQLKQALLLARTPERRDERKEVERLLGDVGYWRASAKLREAAATLADVAKQFDEAAAQRPRHVTDASAWSTYVKKLVEQLRVGPAGAAPSVFPALPATPEHPSAPAGVALPVEPEHPSEPAPVVAPADAGLPSGGVLL